MSGTPFQDVPYARVRIEERADAFHAHVNALRSAENAAAARAAVRSIHAIQNEMATMSTIAYIRHTLNTADAFFSEEMDYYDTCTPEFEEWVTDYYRALIDSPHRPELEAEFGRHLFHLAEARVTRFSSEILADLQQENQLVSEFQRLRASILFDFNGASHTWAQLGPWLTHADRETRRQAHEAKYVQLARYRDQFDALFDQLIQVRHRMAVKLGLPNFIDLAYKRLDRTEFSASDVATFREQIKAHIVPLAQELREQQRQQLGVDALRYYDNNNYSVEGNPKPQGDRDWVLEQARQMYAELSPETDAFFRTVLDGSYLDVDSRPNKVGGGYCMPQPGLPAPFVFANFNGTQNDVLVLTHEMGHAFQFYRGQHWQVPEYLFPTLEVAEIFSFSMEFFTWPWMDSFFGEEAAAYRKNQLTQSLLNLPYQACVDEFQHFVYEHPEATPEERHRHWRRLEQTYLPHLDYTGCDYLEQGGFWQQQSHIFTQPFYYIDYAIGQICGYQFWKKSSEDYGQAWSDYVAMCDLAGGVPIGELLQAGGLQSPFAEGSLEAVARHIKHAFLQPTVERN